MENGDVVLCEYVGFEPLSLHCYSSRICKRTFGLGSSQSKGVDWAVLSFRSTRLQAVTMT
jgi:hypothetical protein